MTLHMTSPPRRHHLACAKAWPFDADAAGEPCTCDTIHKEKEAYVDDVVNALMGKKDDVVDAMTVLPLSIQQIYLVDHLDLEKFVDTVYGLDYSFCDVEDVHIEDDYGYIITGKVDEDDDEEDIKLIVGGKRVPLYRNLLLLDLLCRDGYISPGNYLIQVKW